MQPSIFMSEGFFVSFCKMFTKSDILPKDKKWLTFLDDLIFGAVDVYLNMPSEKIKKILEVELNREQYLNSDEDTKLIAKYLARISNNNKIRDCREAIEVFRRMEFDKYDKLQKKPDFIFLSESTSYCEELSEKFGIFCISNDIHLDVKNTSVEQEVIKRDEQIDLNKFRFLPKCNSLVIEDPYIINNDARGEFIDSLLELLYSKELKIKKYYLTIVYNSENAINTKIIEDRLKRRYEWLILDFVQKRDLHDRNIYSNTFWISCGLGFMKSYQHRTTWNVWPLGKYYSGYIELLKELTKSSHFKNIENPLVKL